MTVWRWTLLLLALVGDAAPALAEGAEQGGTIEYTVRAGDSCESIAEHLYGSRHFAYIIDDYNRAATGDRSQCDANLQVGATLRLPRVAPVDAEAPDAEVSAVLRTVKSRPPDSTDWSRARLGQDLYRGWRVNTLARSAAEVTFRDSSRVHLRENTLVIIFGPTSRRARREGTRAVLERGALQSRLSELSGGVRVETPSATAELAEGESLVTVDRESTSRVANFAGKAATVASKRGAGRVTVNAGMGTKVKRGGTPTPPRHLPPAPAWSPSQPGVFVALPGLGASVAGSWEPVAEAAHYRVAIATEPDGRGPAGSTGVPASVTRFELHGLRPGDYYLGVSTIDSDRFESPPSAWRRIRVVEATLVTPVEPVQHPVDDDSLTPAPPRLFAGSRLVAPPGYQCRLGQGPTVDDLVLTGEGLTSIRCVDGSGAETARTAVDLVPLCIEVVTEEATPAIELARGGSTTTTISLRSALAVPDTLTARAGAGLTIERVTRQSQDALELTVRAAEEAPDRSELELIAPAGASSLVLATVPVNFVESAAGPRPSRRTEEPAERPNDELLFAAHEASWLLVGSNAFGVRDERREGVSLWVGGGYVDMSETPRNEPFGAITAGLQLGAADDRLRFDLAFSVGLRGADTGVRLGARYRVIDGRQVVLSAGLDGWFPSSSFEADRYRARLIPSLDLSGLVARRILLRTRQGALLDTDGEGAFYWASAYGFDIRLVGPLSWSLESVVLLGADAGNLRFAPTVGIGLGLDLWNVIELDAGIQLPTTGFAREIFGRYSFIATVRLIP